MTLKNATSVFLLSMDDKWTIKGREVSDRAREADGRPLL